jgi:RNA polymerase sigma-70 factor (ECF subfamily)
MTGPGLTRIDLAEEAISLVRVLAVLKPDEPEIDELLALLLLVHSRHRSLTGEEGGLVLLTDQDRTQWDRDLVAKGRT